MTKSGKPLWGNSKDAYFRRVMRSEPGVGAAASERLLRRLRDEVVQVRLREATIGQETTDRLDDAAGAQASTGTQAPPTSGFDPYSPNVVVVVRTAGRDRALAALANIDRAENLRLLAREQQLSIETGLDSLPEIRKAIVAAAERRIANRRAAAR
jgi:hypothetical protein